METTLSTDLENPSAIPYFLWDEPMMIAELKQRLTSASDAEQTRLLAKILREARDTDVWKFTTPQEVWRRWDEIAPMLGRRRDFWRFCLNFGKRKVFLDRAGLSDLQKDFLREFFGREHRFYLTGGAALVGFYLGHRETNDLDLFTLENEIESGFAEEILANKLCALLSRSEIQDLVDARELEKAGFNLENALSVAQQKDTGLTAAQLAWVLNQIQFGDDLIPPGNVSVVELRDYVHDLTTRLKRLAFPE